jgi:large subunit ribosomal protein L18
VALLAAKPHRRKERYDKENLAKKTKNYMASQLQKRNRRRIRIRSKIKGTKLRPRLSVFRSNAHIFAQLINDEEGLTIASITTKHVEEKGKTKSEKAFILGERLAEKAKSQKVTAAVFDRGGYQYHGRVKQVAEGARKGGLQF